MVKQRFSTADLAAEVGSLRSKLHGMRVTNVFDISSKVYVGVPDGLDPQSFSLSLPLRPSSPSLGFSVSNALV